MLSLERLLPDVPSLVLRFLGFLSVLSMSSVQTKDFSPLESEEDNEILERWRWWYFLWRTPGSAMLPSGALDLVAANATSATDCSVLELATCGATVSVYMDGLHSTESSAKYLSTLGLVTRGFDPSSLNESIISNRPCCKATLASWSPKMVLSPNTPFASAVESSRTFLLLFLPCCETVESGIALLT